MEKTEHPPWREEGGHGLPGHRSRCCCLILGPQQEQHELPPNPTRASTRTQGRSWCASASENREEEETDTGSGQIGWGKKRGRVTCGCVYFYFLFCVSAQTKINMLLRQGR